MPRNPEPPEQPFTMHESAITAHELFLSLRQAGFSRLEALVLIATVLAGGWCPPDQP